MVKILIATIMCMVNAVYTQSIQPKGGNMPKESRVIFLHHSTGNCVWQGGVPQWMDEYNKKNKTNYLVTEQAFPKKTPYGWRNYPFDYWNIWVNHAGDAPFSDEPTLEMLTKNYDVIVFKHCFPVSSIQPDSGKPDIASDRKTLENYKLQYAALKKKMRSFPKTKFIVWTPAALVASASDPDKAKRTAEFSAWMKKTWDEKGDNIFLWDFHGLETEGGLYLKPDYAAGPDDSHPNEAFSKKVAPLFAQRIVDVITGLHDD
ncbi:MAG: hypothetical protein A2487_14505 [Candidatus Raymondbacteria bacterium RifOxyC12_full_50_8]|uniref:SGNH hydrolase-type esterase domain-containing protein n=1 Tax=Candidatus Raymondbacteria bacterium RIFOXYD12_FULL_49_13 TaxID=1817890 RepID=A0A1F7F6J6_UNCRA|nr:MAG: hypothetical protein A2248_03455 [Candidatus Raymondbacteria bacterium RIFOXYA2_FULL_49_16]OGJ99635.1 MAG: hypothetical protein A2350_16110 [Candidatus Raymondbacteria bacterium RifOxyB12_full_50_8]OGK02126.1 MAG: hypothetical protein A2519_18870 [Candidatus Raymondbacteria bacterium RIFOXYD12_FULL_49_13]OGK06855.1 MAG: hypothetical protein A2487_14505 [Candidatus Raymondbacteria bacterium RifOxyC12_full_50_8]OGP42511.1 MAG: hypothetical protein A2324_17490 [Candidatus Raymondbacteria b